MVKGTISSLIKFLSKYDTYYLLGHEDPDADSIGSLIALSSWLERRGKKYVRCCHGVWDRPEIGKWQHLFHEKIPKAPEGETIAKVLLDCSAIERTGFKNSDFPEGPLIIIDHHPLDHDLGDVIYVDTTSPSCTLIVQKIIESANDKPTVEEANAILLGFCTDTGFFRYLRPGDSESLNLVGRLVKIGMSLGDIFLDLTGNKTLESRKILGKLLQRTQLHFEGRVAFTWENLKDAKEFGSQRDTEMLYQLLSSIKGVGAIVLIKEKAKDVCTVGLRSYSDLDVRKIASSFGGGGHIKASGCRIQGNRQQVYDNLYQALEQALSD